MGRPSMDEIYQYVREVDVNGTNDLDFREFLRLMQLHRSAEVRKIRKVFEEYAEDGLLERSSVKHALDSLRQDPPDSVLKGLPKEPIDYDAFVEVVDACRANFVARQRKKVGYTDKELENFQEKFNEFDKDRSGEIDFQ